MKKGLLLFTVATLFILSCKKKDDPAPDNTSTVTYKLIAGSDCFVSWKQNGADSSAFHVAAPWSKNITAIPGTPLQFIAMNTGTTIETVTARIEVNGVIRQQTGSTCPVNATVVIQDTL